jgi:hypothetical protein
MNIPNTGLGHFAKQVKHKPTRFYATLQNFIKLQKNLTPTEVNILKIYHPLILQTGFL